LAAAYLFILVLAGHARTTDSLAAAESQNSSALAKATLDGARTDAVISPFIFSQFAEHIGSGIYGGLWVGLDPTIPNTRGMRNDVLAALKRLKVPLVRWPGGCFADTYHWRDGIGPREHRPARINARWGGIVDPNAFGTHEFMDFVETIGAEAYINGNVGTSTPAETAAWIEYMTATAGSLADERARNGREQPWKIAYWGVGNELWGCGGQMDADTAADLTRQYSQFIMVPAGTRPRIVASGADAEDYAWTAVMMKEASPSFDALALHYYTIPNRKGAFGSGTDFDEVTYARTLSRTLFMDELLTKHSAIMDEYDPEKRVDLAVDEWGVLTDVVPGHSRRSLFMQNSLRDALLASLNFNIFIRHADRVRTTAIAQMINVAQSMILTEGQRMILTPTYYVYEMYVPFQGATSLPLEIKAPEYRIDEWTMPAVSGVAARGRDGIVRLALTNVDSRRAVRLQARLRGLDARSATGRILTSSHGVTAHNDFGAPDIVMPRPFHGTKIEEGMLTVDLPPHSLVILSLEP